MSSCLRGRGRLSSLKLVEADIHEICRRTTSVLRRPPGSGDQRSKSISPSIIHHPSSIILTRCYGVVGGVWCVVVCGDDCGWGVVGLHRQR